MVRKILYLVLGLVALVLLIAAFLPSSYTVERFVEIERPPEAVFAQVSDYHRWLEWSPWPKMEPAAKQTIEGEPGTVGMTWSWEGEEVGVGSMTIVDIEENRSVHSKLVFREPMSSEADDYVLLEPTESGTWVTWRNTGSLPYPIGRFFGLGVEGMLGPQFEEGLASLKAVTEEGSPAEATEEGTTSS